MSKSEQEVGITSPFGGSVASDEPELAIDEGVPESSVFPNWPFVPDSNVVIQEGKECVRRVLEEIEASDSRTEESSEGDSFVDIMGGLDIEVGVNQRVSHLLTFCDVQIRCQKLYWRVWSVFLICHCVSCLSAYSFSFLLRSNIVAIYILHEIVYSARLFMKMASWGFYVLVFESSRELGDRPQETECGALYSSEPNLLRGALRPMSRVLALRQVLPWKFRQVCSICVLYFGKLATIRHEVSFPGAASDGPCFSEAGDVSTEAEVRHMRRRKQAVITRRLVPLSGQEPGPVNVGSHERS